MAVPLSQMWTVATYVLRQKLAGRRRYPLVLMLEPLFRCNLACAGCGKIQYPTPVLKQNLTPAQCFKAVEECGAPVVAIPGGEPLLHPQIGDIVAGLVARKRYVYLCTNGLLLQSKLAQFAPSKYFAFSVHLDGLAAEHDAAVCRTGVYDRAVTAVRAALDAGFRVTTNTTLYAGADPGRVRDFFDTMMDTGVEGLMVSPGYAYSKAPDQDHFLDREATRGLFRAVLAHRKPQWRFNLSPLFLEFLMGEREFACTPWGMPTYNVFGWQKPCYLLQEGYAETFEQLLAETDWGHYGTGSGNPRCAQCMVHSGYEASAVDFTFSSWRGLFATARAVMFPRSPEVGPPSMPRHEPVGGPVSMPLLQIENASRPGTGS